MINSEKKVSILLAVYNGAEFLQAAIDSIIAQSFNNWELIIVDNGSVDSTFEICLQAAGSDQRIRCFQMTERGKTKAYNLAFEKSQGDIICFFAADDMLDPESLLKRSSLLNASELEFSTCCLKTFSEDKQHDGIVFPKDISQPNYSGGSIMFTRPLAAKIFPLPLGQPNEDTWTSLHLRAFGKNFHVPEALYNYRIHADNSYGYGLSFDEKREKYLHRMNAFELFYDRYKQEQLPFMETDIKPFLKGLKYAKSKKALPILFVNKLNIKSKLVLMFYCSPLLYNVRYKYFKYLSGLLG